MSRTTGYTSRAVPLSVRLLTSVTRLRSAACGQRGQTLVLFAIASTALIALAGLAIEGGVVAGDRRSLQAISDGAALAGAEHLPTPAAAVNAAVRYAVRGLNGGVVPAGCDPTSIDSSGVAPLPDICDPNPPHHISVQTPYNSNATDILVHLDHTNPTPFTAVVGIGSAQIAARAVARNTNGDQPFGFTLYIGGNLTMNGNVETDIQGRVYVGGCISGTNSSPLVAKPAPDGTPGTVLVFDSALAGPQDFVKGSGSPCSAKVSSLDSYGAGGHVTGTDTSCGKDQLPTGSSSFALECPNPPPRVQSTPPPPPFLFTDPYGCTTARAEDWSTGLLRAGVAAPVAAPGCYMAAGTAPGNTPVDLTNITLNPGTYDFISKNGTPIQIPFGGNTLNNTTAQCGVSVSTGMAPVANASLGFGECGAGSGTSVGGVTINLMNGTGFGDKNSSSGCIGGCLNPPNPPPPAFNAPTGGPNFGLLFYDCQGTNCQGSGGNLYLLGPHLSVNLQGEVYAPGSLCDTHQNAAFRLLGQMICQTGNIQGGAVSLGQGIVRGTSFLPLPPFQLQLIE